ncbi:hypothetical protein Sfulv_58340 [Streptomyces fulvorobeus]|uniref:Uncharacterized protein n=1 Tax=Streptomyces fulvorobeus TaxID=284028 RepID=A0A7J0CGJ0_9ACTN|nr:hypothetical protein Sfulv_58340 [Streptomyces fulvorobeus]
MEVTAGGPTHDVRIEDRADAETYVYTEMTTARPGSTVRACFRPASADGEPECVEVRVGAPPSTVGRPHVTGERGATLPEQPPRPSPASRVTAATTVAELAPAGRRAALRASC